LRRGAAGAGFGPQGAQGTVGGKNQGIEAHGPSLLMTNPNTTSQKSFKASNGSSKISEIHIACCFQCSFEVVVLIEKFVEKSP
jgi:hypothetical protein